MKSSTHAGFEKDYNAQVAVDQASLLIVGGALSNHPNDSQEAEPSLAAIPSEIGTPEAAALDAGYFGPATLWRCRARCHVWHTPPGLQGQSSRHPVLPPRAYQSPREWPRA